MMQFFQILFSFLLLTSPTIGSSNKSNRASDQMTIPLVASKGDFNGDGIIDSMWLTPPKIVPNENDCLGNCTSYINFSDPNIPPIKVENCINGLPINLGDLNINGTDEIGLSPEWFSSYWSSYFVWTYSKGKWVQAVPPFSTYQNQWNEKVKPIEIDKNRAGYVVIHYSDLTGEDIVTKSKSVRIKK